MGPIITIWKQGIEKIDNIIDLEELYKTWHILSWIFLIFGYALVIVNLILFPDEPQLLYGLGMFMLSISLVNVFLIGLSLFFLIYLINKEKSWYDYRDYFLNSIFYIIVSIVLMQASLIN
jgi:membrane protease YdiL (CAAX protease family)